MKPGEVAALVAAVALVSGGWIGYRVGASGAAPAQAGAPVVARGDLESQPVSVDGKRWFRLTLLGASSDAFDMQAAGDQLEVVAADASVSFTGLRVGLVEVAEAKWRREGCRREQAGGLTVLDCGAGAAP